MTWHDVSLEVYNVLIVIMGHCKGAHLVGGHGEVLEDEGGEQEELVVLPPEHVGVQGAAPGQVPPGVDRVQRYLRPSANAR